MVGRKASRRLYLRRLCLVGPPAAVEAEGRLCAAGAREAARLPVVPGQWVGLKAREGDENRHVRNASGLSSLFVVGPPCCKFQ